MPIRQVFVASTLDDLTSYRDKAFEIIRDLAAEPRGMERYHAHPNVAQLCIEDVKACDLFVLILAWHYGEPTAPTEKSLSELEYEAACKNGIPVLVFEHGAEFSWPPIRMDARTAPDRGERIEAFRRRAREDGRLVKQFADVESFGNELRPALERQLNDLDVQDARQPSRRVAYPAEYALQEYLRTEIEARAAFMRAYVPLSAVTSVESRPDPEVPDELVPISVREVVHPSVPIPQERIELGAVQEALGVHRQFMLIGEPGSGKTTTLRFLFLENARRYLNDSRSPFPVLVDASQWDHVKQGFTEFITQVMSDTIGATLPPNRLIVLIDGVVETPEAGSPDAFRQIQGWLDRHPAVASVVAARSQQECMSIPVVRLTRLDDATVEALAEVYSESPTAAQELLRALGWNERHADAQSGLIRLVRNPYNLFLMCYVRRKEGALPSTRGELVRRFVQAVYHREARAHPEVALTYDSLLQSLGQIAVARVANRAPGAMDWPWMQKHIPDGQSIERITTFGRGCGILRKAGDREDFEHRLLIEYFAAEFLLCHPDEFDSYLAAPRYANGERVGQRFDDVVRMLFQLEGAARVFPTLSAYDPCLAAEAIAKSTLREDELRVARSQIAEELIRVVASSDRLARAAATGALVQLGIAAADALSVAMRDPRHWIRRHALVALSHLGNASAMESIVSALSDSNRWVRHEAERCISGLDTDGCRILAFWVRAKGVERVATDHVKAVGVLAKALARDEKTLANALYVAAGVAPSPQSEWAKRDLVVVNAGVEDEDHPAEDDDASETEEDLRTWGYKFLEAWDEAPGDAQLASQARSWLATTSMRNADWAPVWSALWRHGRDAQLLNLGKRWVNETDPGLAAWPYVWTFLRESEPDDEELIGLGRSWLQKVPPNHSGWAYTWRALWQRAPGDPELERLGRAWIEERGLANDRWGNVWTALRNMNGDAAALDALGRRWLETTASASPSWSHVWSHLWHSSGKDPSLARLARNWLRVTPGYAANWADVWQNLWREDHLDADLEALGRAWLLTVPNAAGWHRVWQLLWAAHPRDEELAQNARRWLSTVPARHPDWSRVWWMLWQAYDNDSDLIAAARNWLTSVPSDQPGWGYVWPIVMERSSDDADVRALGRKWLAEANPNNPSFGVVWRVEWNHTRERAELTHIGLQWILGAGARHATFGYVWDALFSVDPKNRALEAAARSWLGIGPPHPKGWYHVWSRLWRANYGDTRLADLALAWQESELQDTREWINLWNALRTLGDARARLVALSVAWLRCHPHVTSGADWKNLSAFVNEYGELPDDLRRPAGSVAEDAREAANRVASAMVPNSRWAIAWQQAWSANVARVALAPAGLRWLQAPTGNLRAWPFIWRDLYAEAFERQTLLSHGKGWLRGSPSTRPGWALVWEPVFAATASDMELASAGWAWMSPDFFARASWQTVFERLWDALPSRRDELAAVAVRWLATVAPGKPGSATVWARAWQTLPDDPELARWAQLFVSRIDDPAWPAVAVPFAAAPPHGNLVAPLAKKWLLAHASHPEAHIVKDMLKASVTSSDA